MNRLYTTVLTVFLLSGCGVQKTGEEMKDTFEKVEAARVEGEQTQNYNDAQKEYAAANAAMHAGMGSIPADPDVAFMQGMIPHHQGAVDMAKVVLKHGKDPETRALAEKVIAAQQAEIAQMQAWLAKRGATAAPAADKPVDHSAMGH